MFVSLSRECVVYVVKEVTSSPGARSFNGCSAKKGTLKLHRAAERKLCSLSRNLN